MKMRYMLAVATLALAPLAAHAQGTVPGAADGAARGGNVAGPVGAVVGGAIGAATGTVGGILGVDTRPKFRSYVEGRHVQSYRYSEPLRVGTRLPETGVTYYDAPSEYKIERYKYTVVNDRTVLVDPATGTVVEVID